MVKGEKVSAEVALKIGTRLTFFLGDTEFGAASRIEDILDDRLMVAMPVDQKGVPVIPVTGERVICRAAGSGCYYKFHSAYLDKGRHPIPVWFIKKPEFVEKIQNREFVRIAWDHPIILRVIDKDGAMGDMLFTNVTDISGGGLAVRISVKLPLEQDVILELSDVPGIGILRIKGKVVRCAKVEAPGGDFYHVGFKFVNINRQQQNQLVKFIFTIQRKNLAKGIGKK